MVDRDGTGISISRQSELLSISRGSIYYTPAERDEDKRIMDCIDEIYTDMPFYGSRRMTDALKREPYEINLCREKTRRLMGEMGIEAIYPKPNTSRRRSDHPVYPYLLRNIPAAYPDHIWGTDITYVRLERGWAYLVALMDWYSRYVIDWELSLSLEADFCVQTIARALDKGRIPEIHNSDQGVHFTSEDYLNELRAEDVRISMDGRGRCMDNIFTERLWRSVKYEDIYPNAYAAFEESYEGLGRYFDKYNNRRLHSALGNRPPVEVYFDKN